MAEFRTLRLIAKRMAWKSPATVLRRHKLDDFPLYPDWTKRGLIWATSDDLILLWEERKVAVNRGARLRNPPRRRHRPDYKPYNWRLRDKNRTMTETAVVSAAPETAPTLREALAPAAPQNRVVTRIRGCTCGTSTPCTAH